jgi:hypothetical protein
LVLDLPDHDLLMEKPGTVTYEGGNIGKFMGTVLLNPWFWEMPLEVKLETRRGTVPDSPQPRLAARLRLAGGPRQFTHADEVWMSTTMNQMAVQNRTMGYTPAFDEHMFIPLPFADYKSIREIRAWVNGIPASVEKMDYLFTPPFGKHFEHGTRDFLYYLDGSKNNLHTNFWDQTPNRIVVWVRWK